MAVEGVDFLSYGVVPDPNRRSARFHRSQEFDAQRIGGLPIRKVSRTRRVARPVERAPGSFVGSGPSLDIFFVPPQRLGRVVDAAERLFALLDARELVVTELSSSALALYTRRQRPRSFPEPLGFGLARGVDGVPRRGDLLCEALVLGGQRLNHRLLIARARDERNYNAAVAGRDRALRVGCFPAPSVPAFSPWFQAPDGRGRGTGASPRGSRPRSPAGPGAARHEGIVYRGAPLTHNPQTVRAQGSSLASSRPQADDVDRWRGLPRSGSSSAWSRAGHGAMPAAPLAERHAAQHDGLRRTMAATSSSAPPRRPRGAALQVRLRCVMFLGRYSRACKAAGCSPALRAVGP